MSRRGAEIMAAILGRDLPLEASYPDVLAGPSSPQHLAMPILADSVAPLQLSGAIPQASPRSHAPPPNPHFVFPARPSPSSAPSSYSRATGRRPKSVADLQEHAASTRMDGEQRPMRSPALPSFTFNPGAALPPAPDHAFLSPPLSPQSPRAVPIKPLGAGHRRGGSEFVGGNIRAGDAVTVMSTSPTKSESGFADVSPNLKPTHPPSRRHGHAHRRSAAMSSHDISSILQPTSPKPPVRGNSAPSSPAEFERRDDYTFPETSRTAQTTEAETKVPPAEPVARETATPPSEPASVAEESKPTPKPVGRARVGFSERIEFIPRPLSLVSSDTSSTITVRPSHSVSGSISSLISLSNSTIAEREPTSPLARSSSRGTQDSRPSTAGAVLERTETNPSTVFSGASPRRRNSIPVLVPVPGPGALSPGLPSPTKTPKRWTTFFGIDPFIGASSPTRLRPGSASSTESVSEDDKSASAPIEHAPDASATQPRDCNISAKRVERKTSKKKKKVKTWAGSILARNAKPRFKSRRAPTPPPLQNLGLEALSDAPEPVLVATPTVMVTASDAVADEAEEWQPQPMALYEDDPSFPMIDLDAALGPFNTPLPRNPEWEAAQKAGGLSKRQLHSAAGMSRFTGPGMHYSHRRAESAPEMPPFNKTGIPRYNSSSTMADVFEEDEEDDEGGQGRKKGASRAAVEGSETDESRSSIDIRVTDAFDLAAGRGFEFSDDATSSVALSRRGSGLSGLSDDDKTQPSLGLKSEYSASSLHEEVIIEESSDSAFLPTDSGCSIMDPTDSGAPSPRRGCKGKELTPVDVSPLHLPTASLAPISPYSMTHSSAFPSPRSPMSYDGNRVSTAPSSVTDDNFQSLLMGEPGPEVRMSSDIPSLTSSNSTMTRESAFQPGSHQRNPSPFRSERPASFTSTAFGRRRSSLASLQRLISTSHGERSKLSMEVSCDQPEKKPKVSRTKRLSRMMQFWKPKEEESPA